MWPVFAAEREGETLEQTICRLIETSAATNSLPADFFTRLIWRESSFRPEVTSSAGAQGIAQFMPGTADEQNLADPFDPEQAIPASAVYLAQLKQRFGNFGLAAAAYNGGPTRVANWLARGGFLPIETEDYVSFITGRSVYDWAAPDGRKIDRPDPPPKGCAAIVTAIRASSPRAIEGRYAPFGVQLSGNFSKSRALASYQRVAARYSKVLAGRSIIVIGTRMAGRGASCVLSRAVGGRHPARSDRSLRPSAAGGRGPASCSGIRPAAIGDALFIVVSPALLRPVCARFAGPEDGRPKGSIP